VLEVLEVLKVLKVVLRGRGKDTMDQVPENVVKETNVQQGHT
jgi:hypothetical protein